MDDRGKSDGPVVPTKLPNNAPGGAAEVVEGRGPAKGNAARETRAGLRAGVGVSSDLDRVRRAARRDKDARFTTLHAFRHLEGVGTPDAGISRLNSPACA